MKTGTELYCDKCHALIGNEETLGYYAFKARKYCDKCKSVAYREKAKERQKIFNMKRKEERAKMKDRLAILEEQNRILLDLTEDLKRELCHLKGGETT